MDKRIKDFAVFAGRILARRWYAFLKEKAREIRSKKLSGGDQKRTPECTSAS